MGRDEENIQIFKKLGIEEYFKLPPCGVDVQRAYELMTTMNKDGTAKPTDKDGQKVIVPVNEAIIRDALKFKEGRKDLFHRMNEKDRGLVFL